MTTEGGAGGRAVPGRRGAPARRSRGRAVAVALALPVLIALAAWLTREALPAAEDSPAAGGVGPARPTQQPERVFPRPGAGEAAAVWVAGEPVLLVGDRAGQVHAVEARRPGAPPGTAVAVAWCPAAQVHVSVRYGEVFSPDGGYLAGPAEAGLATYDVEAVGGGVRVGDRRDPLPRPRAASPPATAAAGEPPGPVVEGSCLDEHLEPDHLVLHGWPPAGVTSPEEAVARGEAERVLVGGRLAVGGGRARLCGDVRRDQRPEPCPAAAPAVEGVTSHGVPEVHDGLWRVDVAGGAVVTVTHVRTRLVMTGLDGRDAALPAPPPGASVVSEGRLTVYSFDLGYSDPPEAVVAAGGYRLRLDNRGHLPHRLVSDALGVHLEAAGGQVASASADLPAGDHVLYCDIPGHREAGMELHLTVTG